MAAAFIKKKGLLPATARAGLGRLGCWHSLLLLRGIPPPASAPCPAMADGLKKEGNDYRRSVYRHRRFQSPLGLRC